MNVETGAPTSASATDLHWMTVAKAASAIAHRELSPVELTEALLKRIERLDPRLNAFIKVDAEAALQAARTAESEIKSGRSRGPLRSVRFLNSRRSFSVRVAGSSKG